MLNRKFMSACLCGAMLFLLPVTANANSDGSTESVPVNINSISTSDENNTINNPNVTFGDSTDESDEATEVENKIITPSGNLTLVDDITEVGDGSTQFVTMVSKNGNYFYLVIDRSGTQENVHFLNLVDEADLMALTDGELPIKEEVESPISSLITSDNDDINDEGEIKEVEKTGVNASVILTLIVLVAGGGIYYKKIKDTGKVSDSTDLGFIEGQDDDDDEYVFEDATDEDIDEELNF